MTMLVPPDAIKRGLNVWDGPEDTLENLSRKLRTRGADGKSAETAMIKKKKREQFNMGYVFGAVFCRKLGYRVEGDDRVTLEQVRRPPNTYPSLAAPGSARPAPTKLGPSG